MDVVAECEGEAGAILRRWSLADVDGPTPMAELCSRSVGRPPKWDQISTEAKLGLDEDGKDVVLLRRGLAPARARWLVGHEIAEWWLRRLDYQGEDIEQRADLIGACLVAPRDAFRRAIRSGLGHRIYALASAFRTTQSLALLRVGEVTGRPVKLMRAKGEIDRGQPFCWPSMSTLARTIRETRGVAHPLTIRDEPNRVGLMVRWGEF